MIIHCSKKLSAKLENVSPTPLEEISLLGGWHAHLFTIDRRQCVMFCHDATRCTLFLPGLRKEHLPIWAANASGRSTSNPVSMSTIE